MKLAQVLLTVVLVAAGILVYDLLRTPDGAETLLLPDRGAPQGVSDAGEPDALDVAPPTLDGGGDERRVRELERRLEALELLLEASGMDVDGVLEATSDGERNGSPMGSETPEDVADEKPRGDSDEESGGWELNPSSISKKDLQAFRKTLEWVERQRNLEKAGREIWKWLNRQGVTLEPGQQRKVVIHALRFQAKAKQIRRMPGNDEAAKTAKQAEMEKLGDGFRDQLFDIVPSTEALRIIDALDRQQAEAEARRAQNK